MFVVVIGLGQVGRHVVRTLEMERHDVVAVDLDPEAVQYVEEHHDVQSVTGYGGSQKILLAAKADQADLVCAVTNKDEVNLIAALAARNLGARRTIARVEGRQWGASDDSTGVEYGLLGVDVVFNPKLLIARELSKIAQSHGATEVVELANDRVEIVAIDLDDSSKRTHQPLSRIPFPDGMLIAAIVRDGDLFVPGGNDVLLSGDRIYMVGLPEQLLAAEDLFTYTREAQSVCVVGGGVIGESLASTLKAGGSRVTLVEHDKDRARRIAEEHPGVTVIHGDGTDISLMRDYDIGAFDFFAAVTGEDEINLMAALLAKNHGARRTATVVHRPDYVEIHHQLGINSVLSPRQLASDHVLRFVRHRELKSVATLENGRAQVIEIRALEGARAVGVPIQQLRVPRGALLCAILRGNDVEIPGGNSVIQAGDTVIVLSTDRAYDRVEALFKQRAF